jgi:hypothetical protein
MARGVASSSGEPVAERVARSGVLDPGGVVADLLEVVGTVPTVRPDTARGRAGGLLKGPEGGKTMHTINALRRPRMVVALTAAMGLALVATPAAADQHEAEPLEVDCGEDYFIDQDEDVVYFLTPGEDLECTVTGLMTDAEATWGAELFDEESEDEEPFDEQGAALTVAEDGTASFAIEIPDEPPFIWMNAWVEQGDDAVDFYGTTEWYWEGEMTCTPDPVTEGGTVECVAEDMEPDEEFLWWVVFFDDEDDGTELEGDGVADADGVVRFSFEVPAGEGYVGYEAEVDQEFHSAWFEGEIEPATTTPPPPPKPQPPAQPVTVQQPTRVDTGAGGTAPAGIPPLFLVGGLALAGLAGGIALRRSTSVS